MILPIYQVDAFTDRVFDGNPAAVCPLDTWLSERHMQFIAAENNLSETAFFVPEEDEFRLRWFTPQVEVDLCGHATLATAAVLYRELGYDRPEIRFRTMKAGTISVTRQDEDWLALDFPSRPPAPVDAPAALAAALTAALGAPPSQILAARDYVAIYEDAAAIRALKPDMAALAALDRFAVMVTAPGEDCDFVSRFFAPAKGIPEDPVTGSAHCTLIPYWSARLGRQEMEAHQLSARGGRLRCVDRGDRVTIAGQAVLYMKGELFL
ncbi:PhzF family phenazine biosynthesis protein [Stella humosa]|uniref:PhzF family phenazine biosynthesis protein n=1 Tax=Stella humosa TaxID=94 RepID=A0A3N1LKB7_9PROT|nr:PhzF family phenazine biosynthesis protein [Stella humosa]ROP91318.1 PhzF family phenazine biosynthesis protein [Stella humosa]BBK34326.1 putative isomerase [Stella humosa]